MISALHKDMVLKYARADAFLISATRCGLLVYRRFGT
jgi:hypothetical protein